MTRSHPFLAALLALAAVLASGAAAADTTKQTITVNGIERTYLLHVPVNLKKTGTIPLVLALHGGHGSGRAMERLTKFSDLADSEGFIVAYPDAHGDNWNDGRVFQASSAYREHVDDVATVSAIIDDISRQYPVDRQRIYATGISNGGIMTNYLGAKLSDRLAAIASVAGGVADQVANQFSPRSTLSVLIMQGTADPIMPFNGGNVTGRKNRGATVSTDQMVRLWSRSDGAKNPSSSGTLPDTDPKDGCTVNWQSWRGAGNSEVRLMVLNGAGHTWPGGSQYAPKFLIGGVCRDFDATRVIWDFFKAHPKS